MNARRRSISQACSVPFRDWRTSWASSSPGKKCDFLGFFYVKTFSHTKVENSVSKQGSESKVEGMVSLLLFGETGHFGATKVSEEHLITQGITKSDEWLTVEKS